VSSIASLISVLVVLGGLAAAAVYLRAQRDRLTRHFGQGPMSIKGTLHLGDGSRLLLVDIAGTTLACGVGRNGVSAMQIIGTSNKEVAE